MKLSDIVFQYLQNSGTEDIFMVSGGGIMHLCDSLRKTEGIDYHCNHHEQACVIAAESYSRITSKIGVCLVTTGPGSTNALSAVAGAWVDSIPMLIISGQVRTQIMADFSKQRQLGPQEINIDEMAAPVTKYFKTIMKPSCILHELEKAMHVAVTGRPGPVWINIPLDIQASEVDRSNLNRFTPQKPEVEDYEINLKSDVQLLGKLIGEAERPLILAGNGIRLADRVKEFIEFVHHVKVPVLTSVGSLDVIEEKDPYNLGRIGSLGQRRANSVLQDSDLIIAIGASLSIASIGFQYDQFAPKALKVMVNIDPNEATKPVVKIDHALIYDIRDFLSVFNQNVPIKDFSVKNKWLRIINYFKVKYPIVEKEIQRFPGYVNSYEFVNTLSDLLPSNAIVTTGNSLDIWSVFHSFQVKKGQRILTNINHGAMGWCLPGLIGASVGSRDKPSILITGDGSFQMNIQELLTIKYEKLPVTIFIFDNQGYQSIRSTQDNYFDSQYIGSDANTGIMNPDYEKLAAAYDISYCEINGEGNLKDGINNALSLKQPAMCRVLISPDQERRPRLKQRTQADGSTAAISIDDMFPFRPLEEIEENRRVFNNEG